MHRYLSWRYNLLRKTRPVSFPFSAVVSHSDSDHYGGFGKIFSAGKITFDKIYHNTLVERAGSSNPLGKVKSNKVLSIVTKEIEMKTLLNDPNRRTGDNSFYMKTMYKALRTSPNVHFIGLTDQDEYVPGYPSQNKIRGKKFAMQVLAPLLQNDGTNDYLPFYKDLGKTKNGHSIIIKLQFDKIKILLGGDLNEYSGKDIVKHYDNINKKTLTVDIAKACHHGSNHFHYETLERFNSLATVISSGDDESYSHPRPDTMGAIGKCGYGDRPLIFSTEIARSNKEITNSSIAKLIDNLSKIKTLKKKKATLRKQLPIDTVALEKTEKALYKAQKDYNSALTKFGMINVRTDGQRGIIAQKLERQASYSKWDIHKIEYNSSKRRFVLVK